MSGKFVPSGNVEREELDWGTLGRHSRPPSTGAKQLTVIDVDLLPGKGHDFHKHPDQEEIIFVVNGEIEQWLESNKQTLKPGDSVIIPKDTVHASFNALPDRRYFNRPVPRLRHDELLSILRSWVSKSAKGRCSATCRSAG